MVCNACDWVYGAECYGGYGVEFGTTDGELSFTGVGDQCCSGSLFSDYYWVLSIGIGVYDCLFQVGLCVF